MILKPRYVGRVRHVAAVLVRHGFSDILVGFDLQRFLPGKNHAPTSLEQKHQHRAANLRQAFEELGATYIKLGQLLSTRPEILDRVYIEELEKLQDQVEPFGFDEVRQSVEEELAQPLGTVFRRFDERPVASASLAQVHRAELLPGQPAPPSGPSVAVKVLRPGVGREVELDLEILEEAARFMGRTELGRRYDLTGLVEQLQKTLSEELDLTREARNATRLARALEAYPRLRVPAVVDELTTRRVLVSEYVEGRRIHEAETSQAPPGLAAELWRAYLFMILVDGFFHGDPHPGNFLLDGEGRGVLLDHGMVGHVSQETQLHLMSLLLSLSDRDGDGAAEAAIEIGIPGPEFHQQRFKQEIGQMVARYTGLPLQELNLGRVFLEIAVSAFRNDVKVPPEMMLLGKTLLTLESTCRRLDPALDPVSTMRELARSLLTRQLSHQATRNQVLSAALELRSIVTQIPSSLRRVLRLLASNELRLGLRVERAEEMQASIEKIATRLTLGVITAALIVGSALLLNIHAGPELWGYPVFGLLGFLMAAGLGFYVVAKIMLKDRY